MIKYKRKMYFIVPTCLYQVPVTRLKIHSCRQPRCEPVHFFILLIGSLGSALEYFVYTTKATIILTRNRQVTAFVATENYQLYHACHRERFQANKLDIMVNKAISDGRIGSPINIRGCYTKPTDWDML